MKYALTRPEWSWCCYDVGDSAFSLIVMTAVFPVYYSQIVMAGATGAAATANLGVANSLAGLAVAIAAPLLGMAADRGGARKGALACAVLCGCAATFLMGSGFGAGGRVAALACYICAVFAFTCGNVFYDALLPEVTEKARFDYVSGVGFAAGYLGSVVPFVAILAILQSTGRSAGGFHGAFQLTALWWGLFTVPLLLFVKQRSAATGGRTRSLREGFAGLFRTLRAIAKNRNLALFLTAYFCYIDGVNTVIVMAVPYGAEIGLDAAHLILTVLAIQLVAFPCSFLYGALAERFGAGRMILFGVFSYAAAIPAAAAIPYFTSKKVQIGVFAVLALVVAANQGGIQALSRSCFSKLIPRERAAEYFGFYNIVGRFASVLGPLLVGGSGYFFNRSQFGILSLLLLFGAGAVLLCRQDGSSPLFRAESTD